MYITKEGWRMPNVTFGSRSDCDALGCIVKIGIKPQPSLT